MPDKLGNKGPAELQRHSRRNIRLTIEYDGTVYHGWQRQKKIYRTIQQEIEEVLKEILQEKVALIGAGRTDQGVHAVGQVGNFRTGSDIQLSKLQLGLNSLLPADIVITHVEESGPDFHSIRSAKSKLYRYSILNRTYSSAIYGRYLWTCFQPINFAMMKKEAKHLLGRHDFRSFQATQKKEKTSVRTIQEIKIVKKGDYIYLDIRADGFLYNMVRIIVGTLVDIATGRKIGNIKDILGAKNRKKAGRTAPAGGLCLMSVSYER